MGGIYYLEGNMRHKFYIYACFIWHIGYNVLFKRFMHVFVTTSNI